MSMRGLSVTCTTIPTASQTASVIDSTYRLISGSQATMNASTGTYLTPGPYRNTWPHAVVKVTAKCTTQNMTILYEILTGTAGTSADWEAQGALGTQTVTAGTTHTFEFKPLSADWRVRILSGGTAPSAVSVRAEMIFPTTDYGN